jgi:hypothetical protein
VGLVCFYMIPGVLRFVVHFYRGTLNFEGRVGSTTFLVKGKLVPWRILFAIEECLPLTFLKTFLNLACRSLRRAFTCLLASRMGNDLRVFSAFFPVMLSQASPSATKFGSDCSLWATSTPSFWLVRSIASALSFAR